MLVAAGWEVLELQDVTVEFAQSLAATLEAMRSRAEDFIAALGPEEFPDRISCRQATLGATVAGLL